MSELGYHHDVAYLSPNLAVFSVVFFNFWTRLVAGEDGLPVVSLELRIVET
jgi:hypothetical protein